MRTLLLSSFVFALALPASAADQQAALVNGKKPFLLDRDIRRSAIPTSATRPNIRVDVNMTLVPVSVVDNYGRSVLGLSPENFRIIDGSEQVPIVTFSKQDAPISLGLVFDASRSMTQKFRTAREAPTELYKRLNAQDESFLITIAERAELRQPFTSEFNEIQSGLLFTNPGGTTSLLDGVYLALSQMKKANNPRKAIVVVSDGGDNNSRYTLQEVLDIAIESDTQIFAIGLFDNPETEEEREGPGLLAELSAKTGGVGYMIRNVADLRSAMAKIATTLHNQYVLGYYPPENEAQGKYRKIKVQLDIPQGMPRLHIYAKSGYYTPSH
jgi:Ca-activated chloride channel family protein